MNATDPIPQKATVPETPDVKIIALPQPLCWDIEAVARRLSIAPVTVRKMVRQRRLARVPGIRKLLIPESSIQRFAASAE